MVEREKTIELVVVDAHDISIPGRLRTIHVELEDERETPVIYWVRDIRLYKGKLVKITDRKQFYRNLPKENGEGKLRHLSPDSVEIVIQILNARGVDVDDYLLENPEGYWAYTKDVLDITEDALASFAYSRLMEIQKKTVKPDPPVQ